MLAPTQKQPDFQKVLQTCSWANSNRKRILRVSGKDTRYLLGLNRDVGYVPFGHHVVK